MNNKSASIIFALIVTLGCKKPLTRNPIEIEVVNERFSSLNGWKVDFSEYPLAQEAFYELGSGDASLPMPLDIQQKALRVSGNNHSDDLFMFIKKRITGLRPNQEYVVKLEFKLASNSPSKKAGVGGAPGEGIFLKAGLVPLEPEKILSADGFFRMNIDKGNQQYEGTYIFNIGDIANGTDLSVYKLITRSATFSGKADANGHAWIIIGTDSGFESTTTLYYTSVNIILTYQNPDHG